MLCVSKPHSRDRVYAQECNYACYISGPGAGHQWSWDGTSVVLGRIISGPGTGHQWSWGGPSVVLGRDISGPGTGHQWSWGGTQ